MGVGETVIRVAPRAVLYTSRRRKRDAGPSTVSHPEDARSQQEGAAGLRHRASVALGDQLHIAFGVIVFNREVLAVAADAGEGTVEISGREGQSQEAGELWGDLPHHSAAIGAANGAATVSGAVEITVCVQCHITDWVFSIATASEVV